MYVCMHIYIKYIHTHIYVYVCMHAYIYIYIYIKCKHVFNSRFIFAMVSRIIRYYHTIISLLLTAFGQFMSFSISFSFFSPRTRLAFERRRAQGNDGAGKKGGEGKIKQGVGKQMIKSVPVCMRDSE